MFKHLYEKVTGTPWTTTVNCTTQFGPTIAARYPELAGLSDTTLMRLSPAQAIAYAEAARDGSGEAWMHFIETYLFPDAFGCDDINSYPPMARPTARDAGRSPARNVTISRIVGGRPEGRAIRPTADHRT